MTKLTRKKIIAWACILVPIGIVLTIIVIGAGWQIALQIATFCISCIALGISIAWGITVLSHMDE